MKRRRTRTEKDSDAKATMATKLPWFQREFAFDFPVEKYPDILERLRGTPARAEEKSRLISPEILRRRLDETWSVQENIGHLLDLEPLWAGRVDDILAGAKTLREADLTNQLKLTDSTPPGASQGGE